MEEQSMLKRDYEKSYNDIDTVSLDSVEEHLPTFFLKIPKFFRFDNNVDATAIALDNFARANILMASVFIGPALLELAKAQAISECEGNDDSICAETARVHGFLPSSLLTNIATVAGLVSALVLPLAGAVIDHTPHRRLVGLYSSLGMSVIKAIEIGIGQQTWFVMALLQLVSSILFQLLTVTEYAYAAELSQSPQQQSKYQSFFFLCMFLSMIIFTPLVLIPSKLYNFDDVTTARLGTILSALWTFPIFYICWQYQFSHRQALQRVPNHQSLWSAGVEKLWGPEVLCAFFLCLFV